MATIARRVQGLRDLRYCLQVWERSVRSRLGAGLATAVGDGAVTPALAPDDTLARRVAGAPPGGSEIHTGP